MDDINEIVELIKLDLGIMATARDFYFQQLAVAAREELNARGARLDLNEIADKVLVADYAAWQYRHRETGEGMPEHIRQRLTNRRTEARCSG